MLPCLHVVRRRAVGPFAPPHGLLGRAPVLVNRLCAVNHGGAGSLGAWPRPGNPVRSVLNHGGARSCAALAFSAGRSRSRGGRDHRPRAALDPPGTTKPHLRHEIPHREPTSSSGQDARTAKGVRGRLGQISAAVRMCPVPQANGRTGEARGAAAAIDLPVPVCAQRRGVLRTRVVVRASAETATKVRHRRRQGAASGRRAGGCGSPGRDAGPHLGT